MPELKQAQRRVADPLDPLVAAATLVGGAAVLGPAVAQFTRADADAANALPPGARMQD